MSPLSNKTSFEIRQEIIKEIGQEDIGPFEIWAFGQSPTKYNRQSLVSYNLSRNSLSRVPDTLDEGLSTLTSIWKERFT
jgi:hypothetical protein